MKILVRYFEGLEFDGQLVEQGYDSSFLECRIRPPLFGGDIGEIEIRVPNYGEYLGEIFNPFKIHGNLRSGRLKVEIDEIYYRSYTIASDRKRRTGSTIMKLSHIGSLKIVTRDPGNEEEKYSTNVKSIIFHLAKNDYFNWLSGSDLAGPLPPESSELLATLSAPSLGTLSITREWIYTQQANDSHGAARWGLCAEIELGDVKDISFEDCSSRFEEVLLILSLLTRQRAATVGTQTTYEGHIEQKWRDPLDPLETKNIAADREQYLIKRNYFESTANLAIANFATLSPDLKEVCRAMLVGLVPYIPMTTPVRFLSMFQALEGCRRFSRLTINAKSTDDCELASKLRDLKNEVSLPIAERLDGFIRMVEERTPSLKVQLLSVLDGWGVLMWDLWPLSGTAKLPGLIQVRDKLAHSGPLALEFQALANAERSLSLLLERTILQILQIPLEGTNATPDALGNNFWYGREYMLQQQKAIFYPDSP